MKEILLGRDAQTGKLRITAGNKTAAFGQEKSVPKSVSKEHLLITIGDDSTLTVVNKNPDNDTYVNQRPVEQKRIKEGDCIELGNDRYLLSWDIISPFIPRFADISPLKQVWTEYQEEKLKMQISERRFNSIRTVTGAITPVAMLAGFIFGRDNMIMMALYMLPAVLTLLFCVISWRAASKIPKRQAELTERAKHAYKCPACGKLLQLQDFDMLSQQKGCPYCAAQWIQKQ
jgi:DNA-directed RNA polymerase subunit RPC12/RpoP